MTTTPKTKTEHQNGHSKKVQTFSSLPRGAGPANDHMNLMMILYGLYGSLHVMCLEAVMHIPLSMSPCQDGGFPVETSEGVTTSEMLAQCWHICWNGLLEWFVNLSESIFLRPGWWEKVMSAAGRPPKK